MKISYPDPPAGYGDFDEDEPAPEQIFSEDEVFKKFKELFNLKNL